MLKKGRQLAIEFAKRGSILTLLDIDDVENAKTVEILKTAGHNSKRIYAYHCDLRWESLRRSFQINNIN